MAIIASSFFLPYYMKPVSQGNNIFYVSLNGVAVGVSAREDMEEYVRCARLQIAAESDTPVLLEAEVAVEGDEVYFGKEDSEETIISNMEQVMRASVKETLHRSYMVKINDFTVNLGSTEEVVALLNAGLDKYDDTDQYSVRLEIGRASCRERV